MTLQRSILHFSVVLLVVTYVCAMSVNTNTNSLADTDSSTGAISKKSDYDSVFNSNSDSDADAKPVIDLSIDTTGGNRDLAVVAADENGDNNSTIAPSAAGDSGYEGNVLDAPAEIEPTATTEVEKTMDEAISSKNLKFSTTLMPVVTTKRVLTEAEIFWKNINAALEKFENQRIPRFETPMDNTPEGRMIQGWKYTIRKNLQNRRQKN